MIPVVLGGILNQKVKDRALPVDVGEPNPLYLLLEKGRTRTSPFNKGESRGISLIPTLIKP